MNYFNLLYAFLFLPIVIITYSIVPKKIKYIILLLASLAFFMIISKHLVIYMILISLSLLLFGIITENFNKKQTIELETKEDKKIIKEKYKKKKKRILILFILFNIAFLFFFKYLGFFKDNTNIILKLLSINYSINIPKYIAPIGISFYSLQALSYMIDIHRGVITPEKNILKITLYLSYFPTIMEGPITRLKDVKDSLFEGNKITYKNLCFGYQRILYGFMKKMIIADRLNILVKTIFNNYTNYGGIAISIGVISYTIMLYMEFSGTMDVVIGSSEIFGIKLPENFKQPFFSKNISEFWTRWHITLGSWFKDYIFYPVSLSKPMKKLTINARKILGNHFGPLISGSVALLTVWLLNGLWHGAGWTYIFYGIYMFTLILLGNIFEPVIKKSCNKLKINRENKIYRIFQSIKMTILVFIGELFFKAPTLTIAFSMLKRIFINFKLTTNNELLTLGLDIADYLIIIVTLIVVLIISILKEKNINVREEISKKNICLRWIIYYTLILAIIIFGAYGPGYVPVDPIYADF